MGPIAGQRAREDPGAEPSMAKKRSLMAVLDSAFVADKRNVKHHGQWWVPAMKDSWGAPPRAPADGLDAAVSAWTADP